MYPVEGSGILNDMFKELSVSWFTIPAFGRVLELPSHMSVAEACATLLDHNLFGHHHHHHHGHAIYYGPSLYIIRPRIHGFIY